MRCLVTGGTGFIGRRLVPRLVERFGSANVTCLVKATATPLEEAAIERYRRLGLALTECDLLNRPTSPPPPLDAVFHLAANIDTDAGENELRVNVEGTRNLLEWLAPSIAGGRIVYASSVAVHDRDREPDGPISETSPCVPRTLYGRTKLEGEHIIAAMASSLRYTWTILRLPTVYGPGQKPAGLFDKLIDLASRGSLLGRINWPGRTSIVYVDDVADVMIAMAGDPEAASQVYCVASDDQLTVGGLARGIATAGGRSLTPIDIPAPLLRMGRALVWNRAVRAVVPASARLTFWRLSLILSDGFWFDTAKFRRAYRQPLRSLEQGLRAMNEEQKS